eukprot:7376504-Prymnesium_polylepis.1
MAHSFSCHDGEVNGGTLVAYGPSTSPYCRVQLGSLTYILFGGLDTILHLVYQPKPLRRCRIELDVLKHAEHAHPSYQISVLEGTGQLSNNVVRMQTGCNATSNQGAMNSAPHWVRQRS